MAGKVTHFEISGKGGKKLQEFYKSLFGWKVDADNPMEYGMVSPVEDGIGGGIAESDTPSVTIYVEVENLKAALDKAKKLGGKTVMEPEEVPGGPEIAQFQDPDGNVIGLVKAGTL